MMMMTMLVLARSEVVVVFFLVENMLLFVRLQRIYMLLIIGMDAVVGVVRVDGTDNGVGVSFWKLYI